jgi:hypothetical protein
LANTIAKKVPGITEQQKPALFFFGRAADHNEIDALAIGNYLVR